MHSVQHLFWWAAVAGGKVQVREPCTAVELGVDGLDEPWLWASGADSLGDDDSGDLLLWRDVWKTWVWSSPADGDGVTGVPGLEDVEGDVWLGSLAGLELVTGGEGWGTEWHVQVVAAVVDELNDRVRVVREAGAENTLSESWSVGTDGVGEVVGDASGLVVSHAPLVIVVTTLDGWGGHGADGKDCCND